MNVPKGYKMTEVGVIPEDWEVKKLGDIANVKTGPFGSALHERDYVSNGTPIITVEHLSEFGIVHTNLPMVSDKDKERLKAYSLEINDIVFSRVGSIDRNSLITPLEEGWLFSGRLLRIRINNKKVFSPYLSYYFHTEPFKLRIRRVAVGQTMPSLNTQILNGIDVILPPLPEQRSIARVLSDTDALINALDKLIAKKRDIKKAVMQELLTGKTRLPGFSGEWEVKRLGDVASITMGQSPSSKYYNIEGVGLPLIQGNADIENRETVIRIYTSQITKRCYRNNIILSVRAPVGEVARATFDACIGRGVCAISYPSNFLYQYLMFSKSSWSKLSKGSTFDSVNYKEISNFELYLPSDYAEQEAIAQVLSDMDREITALEQRRDNTKAIKQGMMQALLTGRIRLPKGDTNDA